MRKSAKDIRMLKSELSKNLDEIMLMIHNCAYINEKQSEVISTLRRLISYSPIQERKTTWDTV